MDPKSASGLKRRLPTSSSPSFKREIVQSPPCRSPSLSRSSPSSDRSSPSSASSSPCATSSLFQNHVKDLVRVSSTSVSLAKPSLSASKGTFAESFPRTLLQPSDDYQEEGSRKKDIYDPFHPTEGEKEKDGAIEEDGEKYDPFEPTGSPASDDDDNDNDENKEIKEELANADPETDDEKDEDPPDSTDIFGDPLSPPLATQLSHRRRVDYSSTKVKKERTDSDHSEIEEGEIVVAIERDVGGKRTGGGDLSLNPPQITFFNPKPERILRVLDGDGFVSVCADSNWDVDRETGAEPVVGVEDLRRKLVSKRKERYLAFPGSSPLACPLPPAASPPAEAVPSPPLAPSAEQGSANRKSSKASKDQARPRSKDRKPREKDEKKKKRKKEKEGVREKSKEKKPVDKPQKEEREKHRRSSRSSSLKRKKTHHSSPEASKSRNPPRREEPGRQSLSSFSLEHHRERDREKERDRGRDRDRRMERDRQRERERSRPVSQKREETVSGRSSSRPDERTRKAVFHSSSRERDISNRPRRRQEDERRERLRPREHEGERRRDGRPVVPPSIQDLNGSDLFAIKRTITVTTTTTTTTVPGSPILAQASPCRIVQDLDMSHKRKKKRKWPSGGEETNRGTRRSRSRSPSPPRYHGYESDRYSDKLEIDLLSLDGEALDSDYPSLEDTPPPALPPEPPAPSPKSKTTPKTERQHPKKKGRTSKKLTQSSSSSNKTKSKCLSSLSVASDSVSISTGLPLAKRTRKVSKDKVWDKKDLGRSSKSKKESSGRKGKLQSKVSVLVREGVSSTTGTSVGSGKLGMDLLGPGGTGGVSGGSVVGGSIAVVFCRDNESRSPFLKPCTEPLPVGVRNKDLTAMGKRNSLAAPPSSLASPTGTKSKKTKAGSITSTSSSTSSPSSTLATKRRRRVAKKVREKDGVSDMATGDASKSKMTPEGWSGLSQEVPSVAADGSKPMSPHCGQSGPAPCSSSSSSSSFTSVLPPSSSPPRTPPLSMAPSRDTRESSPDSQTVDSSCKTPEPSFLADEGQTQTSPMIPPSSPPSPSEPQGSTPTTMQPPSDSAPISVASPASSSSVGGGLGSLSLPLSTSDPSSSSVSSSSASKLPLQSPLAAPVLPWSLQTGVDCTAGGVLALTALLFKMEEANIASRAKAQEFIQATSQILSQANQSKSQAPPTTSLTSSQIPPPPPSLPLPTGLSPAQFILQSSLPLVGCTKTPPSHLHLGGGCAKTPPPSMHVGLPGFTGSSGDAFWDNESKDPDKYLKKLHTQERAVEEVKLAIKPYYQRKDINKDDYKDILRKAVHKICHSRTGEINPVKVSNLVKLYVQRYKYFRKHGRKMDEEERDDREHGGAF